MKAYIKIDNKNQEELGNFLTADSEFLKAEYFLSGKTVDEICFDLDKVYKKGTKININGNIATVTRDGSVKYEESPKMIYSYEPFEYIINIIKIFDDKISKYLNNDLIEEIINSKNISEEEMYKKIFYYLCRKDCIIMFDMIDIVGRYMTYFGFIRNVYNDKKLTNKCNVFELMYSFYLIYETFYLFQNLNDMTGKLSLSIFKLKHENFSEKAIIDKINYNLDYLENIDSFSYHSKFDDKKLLWKTDLLFNNSLSLVIYELRMQLSKNTDVTFIICKNPMCLKIIVATNKKQQYCIDNEECKRTRNNQRKKKSRDNKND